MVTQTPTDRDRILRGVAAELNSSLDLDEVLRRVMDRVIELTRAARGFIVLMDPATRVLSVRMARGESGEPADGFRGSRSVVEQVIANREAVLATDATSDFRFRAQESVVLQSLRSVVAVPLMVRGRITGVLYIDNPFRAGIFGPDDREFLEAIAGHAAVAIENARLYTELQRNYQHVDSLRRTFERYVNKTVIDWVLEDPSRNRQFIPGERLEVTMLACDIAGFSSMAQRLPAEEVVAFLNSFHRRMVRAVMRHGGNVDKFVGDGMLVAFGAPVKMSDAPGAALRAAREMMAELEEFNVENELRGIPAVELGIGVDTGPVVAGNIGTEERVEYTLIGIPVNNAAFLSNRRPAGVLVSENTRVAAGDSPPVRLEPVGDSLLKGAEAPIPLYTLR